MRDYLVCQLISSSIIAQAHAHRIEKVKGAMVVLAFVLLPAELPKDIRGIHDRVPSFDSSPVQDWKTSCCCAWQSMTQKYF